MPRDVPGFAEMQRLLKPFWGDMTRVRCGDNDPNPETPQGHCVSTAFLICDLLDDLDIDAQPVRGYFIDARGVPIEHAMVLITQSDTLMDLTLGQFQGEADAALFGLSDPEICVQETSRINLSKAPEDARFVTLLNRPNPVGYRPQVLRWYDENPRVVDQMRNCIEEILEASRNEPGANTCPAP